MVIEVYYPTFPLQSSVVMRHCVQVVLAQWATFRLSW